MGDKDKLITQVLTSFFNEPKYYGDNSGDIVDLLKSAAANEPEFVAQLGIFARTQFNMRSISHVIGAVLANVEAGKPYTRRYVNRVCRRADDMTEILACYISMFGKPIPNSLKKGLTDALRRFDEYSLAKYDRDGAVKIRDMIQICHPAPKTKEQEALWKKALERNLETPTTWETQLSANGNNAETWQKLIADNSLGYMAMLRNMRNILEAQPNNLSMVYYSISDAERVKKSRVLPFRFYSAYQELKSHPKSTSRTIDALESAIEASTANIPLLAGKTLVAIDVSGSMGGPVSQKSKSTCRDIACLIGSIANKICEDALVVTFDTSIRKHTFSRNAGILDSADSMGAHGGGTDIHLPFQYLIENKLPVDRVVLLSDNEINRGLSYNGYGWYGRRNKTVQQTADECREKLNKDMWVHAIDLQGYGTQQFIGNRTNIIAGWSEKILEFISLTENGTDSLMKRIESIEI